MNLIITNEIECPHCKKRIIIDELINRIIGWLRKIEDDNSPSQQTSVDKRDVVHTKKTSDAGVNPVSDTTQDEIKKELNKGYDN